jgi:hypothetical protein
MKIKNQGSGLENIVAEIYRDLGYLNVEQNVRFTKKKGYLIHAEIDISYKDLLGNTVYVECKYHKDKKVSFEEYAKFCQVLNVLNIPKIPLLYRGEMVTNNYYDERTKISAEKERIKLIDGDELKVLEEKRKKGFRLLIPLIRAGQIYKNNGLFSLFNYIFKRSLDVDSQIRSYMK